MNDSSETLDVASTNSSTLTLVTPPHSSSSTLLVLSGTADSFLNTSFASQGAPKYQLRTIGGSPLTYFVCCAGDTVVAGVDRALLEGIRWPSAKETRNHNWARFLEVYTMGSLVLSSGGRSYVWVANSQGQMACAEQGALTKTLAWFEPSTGSASVTASMTLVPGGPCIEYVLVSWVLLAERARQRAAPGPVRRLAARLSGIWS